MDCVWTAPDIEPPGVWRIPCAIRALHQPTTGRMVDFLVSHCIFAWLVQRPTLCCFCNVVCVESSTSPRRYSGRARQMCFAPSEILCLWRGARGLVDGTRCLGSYDASVCVYGVSTAYGRERPVPLWIGRARGHGSEGHTCLTRGVTPSRRLVWMAIGTDLDTWKRTG